jgi:hypothetical protein
MQMLTTTPRTPQQNILSGVAAGLLGMGRF